MRRDHLKPLATYVETEETFSGDQFEIPNLLAEPGETRIPVKKRHWVSRRFGGGRGWVLVGFLGGLLGGILLPFILPRLLWAIIPFDDPGVLGAQAYHSAVSARTLRAAVMDLTLPQVFEETEVLRDKALNGVLMRYRGYDPSLFRYLPKKAAITAEVKQVKDGGVTVAIAGYETAQLQAVLLDSNGKEVGSTATVSETGLVIRPERSGTYTLKLLDSQDSETVLWQDFSWGVLALNTNKSTYAVGETAKLEVGVLDPEGEMVCDAKVDLVIRNADSGKETQLSTANGTIIINPGCSQKEFTLTPDYEGQYMFEEAGAYQLTVTAETEYGIHTINDEITVLGTTAFDIERVTATRIYPRQEYPVIFVITPRDNYRGEIAESIPRDFQARNLGIEELKDYIEIDNKSYMPINKIVENIETGRTLITWEANLEKDKTYVLGYEYTAPLVSPAFYLLGPLQVGNFAEDRQWQVASDSLNELIMFWDDAGSDAPAGWTCISCAGGAYENVFPRGAATYGASTGGSATHTHSLSVPASSQVSVGSGAINTKGSTGTTPSGTHTHAAPASGNSITDNNNLPAYQGLKMIRYPGIPSTLPAGVIGIFDAAPASGSWTQVYTGGNIVRGAATVGTGGNNTPTHTVTVGTSGAGADQTTRSLSGTGTTIAGLAHTHAGGSVASNGPSIVPPYADVMFYKLTSTAAMPIGMIGMFDATAPTQWTLMSGVGGAFDNKFLRGAATFGGSNGTSTHDHTNVVVTTQGAAPTATTGAGSSFTLSTHTHTYSVSLGTGVSHLPVYRDTVIAKYDPPMITVSGYLRQAADETTAITTASGTTVSIKVEGGSTYTTTVDGSGYYEKTNVIAPTAGGAILVYLDNHASIKASTVTISDGSTSIGGLDLIGGRLVARSDKASTNITVVDFADVDTADADDLYSVSPFTVTSDIELHVNTGDTFDPNATVTTQGAGKVHVDDSGVARFDTATSSIGGDLVVDNGASAYFDASTNIVGGDITTNGTAQISYTNTPTVSLSSPGTIGNSATSSISLYNLIISGSGAVQLGSTSSNTIVVASDVTVQAGSTLDFNSKTLDVNGGDVRTIDTGAIVCTSCSGGGVTISGSGSYGIGGGSGAITFYNLTLDGTANTTDALSDITVLNGVNVGAQRTLAMGGNDLTVGDVNVAGSGDVVVNYLITQQSEGTTTIKSSSGGTASISGSGAMLAYNLTIGDGSTAITSDNEVGNVDITVTNNFTVNTNASFLGSSTADFMVGNNFINSGNFDPNEGMVTMDGSDAGNTITTGSSSFYSLTFNDSGTSGAWSFVDSDVTVSKNFTITGGSVTAPTGTLTVNGDFTNNDSFTHNSGTVSLGAGADTTQQVIGAVSSTTVFNNLSATGGDRVLKFGASATYQVIGNLTLTGTSCTNLLAVRSTAVDTRFTITHNTSGTNGFNYLDLADSSWTNALSLNGTNNAVNSGNNNNLTVAAAPCLGVSTDNTNTATAYSFQRKTFYDSTNSYYWMFVHDGDEIEIKYSADATNWNNINPPLGYDTNDFSVWNANISSTEYVFIAITSGNSIVVKRGTLGAGTINWHATTQVALTGTGADDAYSYPYISLDSNNMIWVLAKHKTSGNYVVKAADSKVAGGGDFSTADFWNTASQLSDNQTDANVYGNIVPLSDGGMYATFVKGTSLEGCKWVDGTTNAWQNSSGASCVPTTGGGLTTVSRSTGGAVKISDASNFGSLSGDSTRQVVQTLEGTLYAVINKAGSCEVWKSDDGSSWSEQDSGDNPSCTTGKAIGVAIDGEGVLHIAYQVTIGSVNIRYVRFTTSDNQFGIPEDADTFDDDDILSMDIAVDLNNKPHIVTSYLNEYVPTVEYTNKVGSSWKASVEIENQGVVTSGYSPITIIINEDNIPEVAYIDLKTTNKYLTTAVGNVNDAASFTVYDADTSVNTGSLQASVSMGIDADGNTWVAYVDENGTYDYVALAKHADASAWNAGWTIGITNAANNIGYKPSLAVVGKSIVVFYSDESSDQKLVYDVYNSGSSTWKGETVLASATGLDFLNPRVRYSNYYDYDPNLIDVIYSDGTDVYWNYTNLLPANIDNASDFGALPATGRQVLRTSAGKLYTVLEDGGSVEVWSSQDGTSWQQEHSAGSPAGSSPTAAINGSNNIGIVYGDFSSVIKYVQFNTTTNQFGTSEPIFTNTGNYIYSWAIAFDSLNKEHVVVEYDIYDGMNAVGYVKYSNKVSGSWKDPVGVGSYGCDGYMDCDAFGSVSVEINEDNLPEIIFINNRFGTNDILYAAVGDVNNATSFSTGGGSTYAVDSSVYRNTVSQIENNASLVVDTVGNTWISYIDATTKNVTLARHPESQSDWTQGWTFSTNSKAGYNSSVASDGKDIYVFYSAQHDSVTDDIVYAKYDGTSWGTETVLQVGTYKYVKTKYAFNWNNFGTSMIDYLYSDGTDVYWSYLGLRNLSKQINDSSDFGSLNYGATHMLVRNSAGNLYAPIAGTSCGVWTSPDNGNTWVELDSTHRPSCEADASQMGVVVDSHDVLHIIFAASGTYSLTYITFDTVSNLYGASETITGLSGTSGHYDIALDKNDVPHVVNENGTTHLYSNRVGGAWKATPVTIENDSQSHYFPSITVNEDNIPEVAYVNYSQSDLTVGLGNTNSASSFSTYDVDTSISNTGGVTKTAIEVDTAGNTWVAYVGSSNIVRLAKHNDTSSWTLGWSTYTNSNTGSEPSITIIGGDVYVIYENIYKEVAYDVFDGSSWSGETTLETGKNYTDVKIRTGNLNSYDSVGVAPTQTNTYFFNASDAAASGSDWTTPSEAFDSDIDVQATTITGGSTLSAEGTNAPTAGGTITSVRIRANGWVTAYNDTGVINFQVYTDSHGQSLGFHQLNNTASTRWSTYLSLSDPTGGWTWQKLNDLEISVSADGDMGLIDGAGVGKIELLVESTNSGLPNEIDYLYSDGTDVWYNSLAFTASEGNQDSIDELVISGVTKNISTLVDGSNTVHVIYMDDETTDKISHKKWTSAAGWDASSTDVDSVATDTYLNLSRNTANGDIYAVWGDTADNKVYQKKYSSNTWEVSRSEVTGASGAYVTTNYSAAGKVWGAWTTGAATPFALNWAFILAPVSGAAPTVQGGSVAFSGLNGNGNLEVAEGTTNTITWTATVNDSDGSSNITSARGRAYRSGVSGGSACTLSNNNCYEDVSCTLSACAGNSCTATCSVDLLFFAEPTDSASPYSAQYWVGWVQVTDAQAQTGEGTTGTGAPDVQSMAALNIASSIAYGDLLPGDSTSNKSTTITNTGNTVLDIEVIGDNLCTNYPTCSGATIPVGNQEYSTNTFLYGNGTILTTSPNVLGLTVPKSTVMPANSSTSMYWGIEIPSPQADGVYGGANTISAIDAD